MPYNTKDYTYTSANNPDPLDRPARHYVMKQIWADFQEIYINVRHHWTGDEFDYDYTTAAKMYDEYEYVDVIARAIEQCKSLFAPYMLEWVTIYADIYTFREEYGQLTCTNIDQEEIITLRREDL